MNFFDTMKKLTEKQLDILQDIRFESSKPTREADLEKIHKLWGQYEGLSMAKDIILKDNEIKPE